MDVKKYEYQVVETKKQKKSLADFTKRYFFARYVRMLRMSQIYLLKIGIGLSVYGSAIVQCSAQTGLDSRVLRMAAPFLLLPSDAAASALGATGAATSPNLNSTYWNLAKAAFVPTEETPYGAALSFTPLLANIKGKVSNSYFSGIFGLRADKVLTASFHYFTTGNVVLTDEFAHTIGDFTPNEYAVALGYAQAFGPLWSMGLGFRYIRSSLLNLGAGFAGSQHNPGQAFAADFGIYYRNKMTENRQWSFGLMLSNIGTKLYFEELGERQSFFLPMNLRLGTQYSMTPDSKNTFRFSFDLNKLLIPSPAVQGAKQQMGKDKNQEISSFKALYQSFYDAPGGFSEELKEIQGGLGAEWNIRQVFSLRAGITYQHPQKGQNRFFSTGLGYVFKSFGFDLAYLLSYDQNISQTRNNTFVAGANWRF